MKTIDQERPTEFELLLRQYERSMAEWLYYLKSEMKSQCRHSATGTINISSPVYSYGKTITGFLLTEENELCLKDEDDLPIYMDWEPEVWVNVLRQLVYDWQNKIKAKK